MRILVAVVTRSAVGLLVFVLVAAAILAVSGALTAGDFVPVVAHGIFFFFWFGWPLALVITAAVAVPAFHFLRRRGWLTAGRVLMIGTVAGGIIIPLVWAALWGISDVTDPIELLKGC